MKHRITVVDRAWAEQLDADGVEAVVSLGMYSKRASLLFEHTDEWFHVSTDTSQPAESQRDAFWGFFIPYYTTWASLVYVVWEALKHLKIDDLIIKDIVKELDIDLFRNYRNSTFHFDRKFRSEHQRKFLARNGFIAVRKLFERQEELVLQMLELIKHNPHYNASDVRF